MEQEQEQLDFASLNLQMPDLFKRYPIDKQRKIYEYLSGLNDLQKKGYEIAFSHLGTSFNIERSNGYKDWLAENKH